MLPFVVSGVYVVGGGLTAGSMMVLLLFCRLRVGQLVRPDSGDKRRGLIQPRKGLFINFPFPSCSVPDVLESNSCLVFQCG